MVGDLFRLSIMAAGTSEDLGGFNASQGREAFQCHAMWMAVPCKGDGVAHIILAVTDEGSPSLTSYRQIILKVRGAGVR